MKNIILTIILLVICNTAKSQSDFDLSQRWLNQSVYNPAAIGNSLTTTVYSQTRVQWIGLEGAPVTAIIGGNMFFSSIRSSVGVNVDYDKIGFTGTYSFRASYAYYIPIAQSALSFGLSASIIHRNQNAHGALINDPGDPELLYGSFSETKPDFDFGMEFNGPLRVGVSVRHLFGINGSENFDEQSTNIWAYASKRLNISQELTIAPTISYTKRNNFNRYELGAIFYFLRTYNGLKYNDKFWAGAMYRLNDQFSFLAGMYITPKIRLGYSFDYAHSDLAKISKAGTHEIFMSFQFKSKRDIHNSRECPAFKRAKKPDELPLFEIY